MTQSTPSQLPPSTAWQEKPTPDEAERYAGYARAFAALQARKNEKYGTGRALHRKQITAASGTLEVLGDLPEFAAHGLFAQPGTLDVLVRLSNGGMDKTSDRRPDVRGFSLRVLGVQGDSALGNGPAKSQDFTLINQEKFAFAGSDEFVGLVVAASQGGGALFKYLLKRYGLVGGVRRMAAMAQNMKKPFGGFATEPMYSSLPMACGPYAVRVRLVPAASNGSATPGAEADWGADFCERMAKQDLNWELQLQPFVSEALTPIEDASVNWTTPYVTVARLRIPQQLADSPEGKALAKRVEADVFDPWQALAKRVEADVFDPWQALAAHRPLGDVQRARKVVYYQSQKGRGAA